MRFNAELTQKIANYDQRKADEKFYALSELPENAKELTGCTTLDDRKAFVYMNGYTAIGFYSGKWYAYN